MIQKMDALKQAKNDEEEKQRRLGEKVARENLKLMMFHERERESEQKRKSEEREQETKNFDLYVQSQSKRAEVTKRLNQQIMKKNLSANRKHLEEKEKQRYETIGSAEKLASLEAAPYEQNLSKLHKSFENSNRRREQMSLQSLSNPDFQNLTQAQMMRDKL